MITDEITKELANSLGALLESLDHEAPSKVLELNSRAESNNYFRELTSISNSLEQYKKKEVGLLYIGFLGSYSSGKSSTINSLLGIRGSKNERATGNNPTDDHITLITNDTNVENVFTFSKEGTIPIRTKTNFQSEFLENIVLMDTPGSGDPNIIEEIVRDSLPLCDLIIYTLNSTAPFTTIDSPFLIAQQDKLKDIPLIFVLTRGDEFRKSRSVELTQENFDFTKYQKELQVIINRISETIPLGEFKTEDFILIDNLSNFNISELSNRLKSLAKKNSENLVILHNHKLNYFRKEIKRIHDYFLALANSKIDNCKILIEKAEDNSEYFDDQIDVSKIKLRSLWNENVQVFSGIFGQVENSLQRIKEDIEIIKSFKDSGDLLSFRQKIRKKIDEESAFLASKIIRELESQVQVETLDLKEKILEAIDFQSLSISSQNLRDETSFKHPLNFPYNQETYLNEAFESFRRKALSDYSILKDQLKTFKKVLLAKRPLDPTNDNILKYREALRVVMDVYYQALEMYNSAVFSFEVRTIVGELGLASEFDKLEASGISRNKYNSETEKELSGNYEEFSNEFLESIKQPESGLDEFEQDLINSSPDFSFHEELNSEVVDGNNFEDDQINSFISNVFNNLITNVQAQLATLRSDIIKLKKQRRIKYLIAIFVPFVLIGLAYVFKNYSHIKMSTSLLTNIGIAVIVSIVAALIIRAFDKFEKLRINRIEDFKKQIYAIHNSQADELLKNFKEQNEARQKEIASRIKDKWLQNEEMLLSKLEGTHLHNNHNSIIAFKERLNKLVNIYQNSVSQFNQKVLSLFNSDKSHLEKIEIVASAIKQDSIEPSSQLLNKTLEEILSVKEQIEKVEY